MSRRENVINDQRTKTEINNLGVITPETFDERFHVGAAQRLVDNLSQLKTRFPRRHNTGDFWLTRLDFPFTEKGRLIISDRIDGQDVHNFNDPLPSTVVVVYNRASQAVVQIDYVRFVHDSKRTIPSQAPRRATLWSI